LERWEPDVFEGDVFWVGEEEGEDFGGVGVEEGFYEFEIVCGEGRLRRGSKLVIGYRD
jgi:hypothetical protein